MEPEETEQVTKQSPMLKVATFIVDRRNLFFLLFALGMIFCAISASWTKVENSLAAYLPDSMETRVGLDLMDEQFVTYGTARVMVMNIDLEKANDIADELRKNSDIAMLSYNETTDHYNNFSALYSITFNYKSDDDKALEALEKVKESLSDYDVYVSTSMGDPQAALLAEEMKPIRIIAVLVVLIVLLLTSQTYAEVPVLLITFAAAALLSAGTNFQFGTISFVSNSVTIVLQLALSVDYAVIFCNRYKEEHQTLGIREACIVALSKAIPEISSSCLTTVGGLLAMMMMQYGIGSDLATCLIKSIFFSLMSVFLLMPGLLMLFGPLMDKTKHKSFIPRIDFAGKFAFATRKFVPIIFLAVMVVAFFLQNKCPYVFGYSLLKTPIKNEVQIADGLIEESFGRNNFVVMCFPKGNYESEKKLIADLEREPQVDHCMGLGNTKLMGHNLTDKLTAREFSELMDVDYEVAELLYTAYAVNDENYAKLVNGISTYSIPLIDVIMFLYDEVQEGYVTLDDDVYDRLKKAHDTMLVLRNMLEGEEYSRILVYIDLPQEGEETFAFLDRMHEIGEVYYPEDQIILTGDSTSQRDLKNTFARDNIIVTVGSILIVLAVLLFTFMSAGMPLLLIAVIEGAIWINFATPTLQQNNVFFMCELIVSAVQMGANIDYAIVIAGRFMENRKVMDRKEAVIETLNFAFPTIITSGSMMVFAGLLIGRLSSNGSICGIGKYLSQGTIISIILVMFVLPQILLIGERIIEKTSFKVSVPIKLDRARGYVRVDGLVRGQVNGFVVGEMHGMVKGEVNAIVSMGGMSVVDPEEAEHLLPGDVILPDDGGTAEGVEVPDTEDLTVAEETANDDGVSESTAQADASDRKGDAES